ncbi:hypothetical protein BKA62DRAFT_696171 [Auriculariales sp. MPI-PUGE-AT-0066]|nr:hypothetical protein BKA62DRAFT_696171 [Auriculariales sp. MPI-PUGE-AT-0066]
MKIRRFTTDLPPLIDISKSLHTDNDGGISALIHGDRSCLWSHSDFVSAPQSGLNHLQTAVAHAIVDTDLDVFKLARSTHRLRVVDIRNFRLDATLRNHCPCTLPIFPCSSGLTRLKHLRVESDFQVNLGHLHLVCAHSPGLEILEFRAPVAEPYQACTTFVPLALRRYTFHCAPNTFTGIGWALPLISARQTLREVDLSLASASDLDEWVQMMPSDRPQGACFPRLRSAKFACPQVEAFARLLLACPVLRTLDVSLNLSSTPDLSPLETLLTALPNSINRLVVSIHPWLAGNSWNSWQGPSVARKACVLDIAFLNLLEHQTLRPLRALTVHVRGPSNHNNHNCSFPDLINGCKTLRIVLTLTYSNGR